MKKRIGYYIFAGFFCFFRLFPLQKKKVFMIATHDDSGEGNIGLLAEQIRTQKPDYKIVYLTKRDGIRRPFSFFLKKAYHMATAGTICMDNVFMPMAYTPISPKAKVVQLWHGTGTIKKFGQDSDVGEVAEISKKGNKRITHLIVNSEKTKKQYAGAFGIPEEKAYILGLPRTDLILDKKKLEAKRKAFYDEYPDMKGKKITLYAPTFRDSEIDEPKVMLDFESFIRVMKEDEMLLLRLHPFVAERVSEDIFRKFKGKIQNMSGYSGVTTLLAVADCLITDYSSIIYEYCLLRKPMIFYAYDLEQFRQSGRNFYEDYESLVPGPVVKSQEELEQIWQQKENLGEDIPRFMEENFAYFDKNSVNRLLELIFE